jgi:predicted phage terminase large subunit-like protein
VVQPVEPFLIPHPGQVEILDTIKRFNIIRCGRRFGKTQLDEEYLWTGRRGLAAGFPVGWFAPNYKYLTDPWRELKMRLRPWIAHKDEVERRIELTNGGSLEMWTCDGEDPARGRKFAKIVVDEAAMVRNLLNKWQQAIRPTLTDYRGGALFTTTPKGRNDLWRLEQLALKRPEQWGVFHYPTIANPYIDPDEIEEAKQDLPTLVFRQEYLAEYVDFGGALIHAEWLQHGAPDFTYPIILGVDLAISTKTSADYTAIVAMTRDKLGRIFVLWAIRFRSTFNDIIAQIVKAAEKFNPVKVMVESNQFQAAVVQELVRTTDLPIIGVHRDKDKLTSFLPMVSKYEHGLVFHAADLPIEYENELLAFTGGPDDDHDDFVDATGTAYSGLPALGESVVLGPARESLEEGASIIVGRREDKHDWRGQH